jgi:hypothetical protein
MFVLVFVWGEGVSTHTTHSHTINERRMGTSFHSQPPTPPHTTLLHHTTNNKQVLHETARLLERAFLEADSKGTRAAAAVAGTGGAMQGGRERFAGVASKWCVRIRMGEWLWWLWL